MDALTYVLILISSEGFEHLKQPYQCPQHSFGMIFLKSSLLSCVLLWRHQPICWVAWGSTPFKAYSLLQETIQLLSCILLSLLTPSFPSSTSIQLQMPSPNPLLKRSIDNKKHKDMNFNSRSPRNMLNIVNLPQWKEKMKTPKILCFTPSDKLRSNCSVPVQGSQPSVLTLPKEHPSLLTELLGAAGST